MTALTWPRIADVETKTLSAVALELALWCYAQRISENGVPNRGTWVDEYQRQVGLPVPEDPTRSGWPWCTAAAYAVFREAARQKGVVSPFPKTAKAVAVYQGPTAADPVCRITNPLHGSVFVLSHGRSWAAELDTGKRLTDNGHIGWDVLKDGAWWSLSANTNAKGSREGTTWNLKAIPDGGGPESAHGGVLLGRLNFDLAPTRAAA